MVVPIVVAAGARVAATTAARAGASAATRAGASAVSNGGRAAARAGANTARSAASNSGRNIVRARRSGGPATAAPAERPLRPSRSKAIDRTENIVRNQVNGPSSQQEYDEDESVGANVSSDNKPRIGLLVSIILVGIAFMFDVLEVILDIVGVGVGGFIKDFIQIPFFAIVFWLLGAPYWKGKKVLAKVITTVSTSVVSLIPIISTVTPEATVGVIAVLILTRLEDAGLKDEHVAAVSNIIRSRRQ